LEAKKEGPLVQNHTLVSADLAKDVFQIAASEQPGTLVRRPRLRRDEFLKFFPQTTLFTLREESRYSLFGSLAAPRE
jgi:hypothetical protein